MADVRINALATTATSAASDDYLALDGSANGTRKILATNVAQNVTDVTFGTSGPSAKSSIAARAARQGLVFDGTSTGATLSVTGISTGDFSAAAWVSFNSFTGASVFGQLTGVLDVSNASTLRLYDAVVPTSYEIAIPTLTAGKVALLTWVRSGGVLYGYVNGVLAGSIACTISMSEFNRLGSINGNNKLNGSISGALIYNRALSAAEVVSLYESGVPSGADYNSASNTSVVTGFANGSYSTFTGASATGFTAAAASGSNYAVNTPAGNTQPTLKVGQKVLVTFTATLTSGAAPTFGIRNNSGGDEGQFTVTAGSNSAVITMTKQSASDSIGNAVFRSTGATSYAISNFSLTYLGLLLAPDAAQAGGGLTWYDTSGNAANITLPASGVTWNVPSSRTLGGNWTTTGNHTVSGEIIKGNSSGYMLYAIGSGGNTGFYYPSANGATIDWYADNAFRARFASTGNVLLGTTTDSGNGKLQLATHTTSAGGIGFGTEISLYRQASNALALNFSGGVSLYFGSGGSIAGTAGTNSLTMGSDGNVVLKTNSTTALTLDSSQRCILSGALRLNNAYTAGAPTATGYVTIQDSAGNTYKVLVGT